MRINEQHRDSPLTKKNGFKERCNDEQKVATIELVEAQAQAGLDRVASKPGKEDRTGGGAWQDNGS
jgi:hypothetical protein